MRRALVSVSDKKGIVEFCKELVCGCVVARRNNKHLGVIVRVLVFYGLPAVDDSCGVAAFFQFCAKQTDVFQLSVANFVYK